MGGSGREFNGRISLDFGSVIYFEIVGISQPFLAIEEAPTVRENYSTTTFSGF
jgi:hypothetical protein